MSTPLEALRAAVKAAFGAAGFDLEAPRAAVVRVVRAVGTRLSLQSIDVQDQTPNANPIEVWHGVPGASCDPKGGEEVVLSFVGANQTPFVTSWSPVTVPVKLRFDASTEVRFVSLAASVGAKVCVGATPTLPVALAPNLVTYLQALEACLAASDAVLEGLVGIVYTPLKATRLTAASSIANIPSSNLEAK